MRNHFFPILALCLMGLACASTPTVPTPSADPSSERNLPAGRLVGTLSEAGAHVWRGIPFAKAPVGELRWRAPEPLPPWLGTFRALESGPACVQYPIPIAIDVPADQIIGDEDCLRLNVFAPAHAPEAIPRGASRHPVMVWIHGGANLMGESATYDWSRYAARHGVVVVALNYRLGLFGWFRHPALWNAGDDAFDRSGNFGTLDLIRGLEWVRENIASLGGDPGNVTIFGESAGGNNVVTLLLSKPAKGLFHRAISQSGGTWSASVSEAENWSEDEQAGRPFSSREVIARLLRRDGIVEDRAAAKRYVDYADPAALARYLRKKPAYEIMQVLEDRSKVSMRTVPLTLRGGVVVPEGHMIESFARGEYTRVPTILGTNRDESKLFLMGDPEYVWKLFWTIPRIRDVERYERDASYASAAWKADGADQIAIEMERHQPGMVWGYRFDWDEEPAVMGTDFGVLMGAAHGLEIPFVMGVPLTGLFDGVLGGEQTEAGRKPISDAMGAYWAQFARVGAPGRGGSSPAPGIPALVEWTPWSSRSEDSPRFMVFDTPADGGIRMSADYQTPERLAEAVFADPRFATQEERCAALGQLVESFPRYTESDRSKRGC